MSRHSQEVENRERFEFGANWARFLERLTEDQIERAEESLTAMLGLPDLTGLTFLDVGSGSGLFSLAARRLGATVHSLDYDPKSVACTAELRRRFFPDDPQWIVEEGSALDATYLDSLGSFDIVYSWGVLHHTGDMWRALDLVHQRVAVDGLLYIALYNDMGAESDRWRSRKRTYCRLPHPLRNPYAVWAMLPYELKDLARATLRLRPVEYIHSWTKYERNRGMSRWRDIIDWVGGYPYEVADTDTIVRYYEARGFKPVVVKPTRGLGCNEFVFRKNAIANDPLGSQENSTQVGGIDQR